jgi:hypothetical protein
VYLFLQTVLDGLGVHIISEVRMTARWFTSTLITSAIVEDRNNTDLI